MNRALRTPLWPSCLSQQLISSVIQTTLATAVLVFGLSPLIASSQGSQLTDSNTHTQALNFPVPIPTGTIGQKASGAVTAIAAYVQAVSAAGWQDLEGTGTLTYPGGDTHAASLYLLGSEYTRLDIVMDSGTRSLRVQNLSGKFPRP